jgi:aspartyl-tRNA(Asn)/glutamyl-tRNA(Gln) amidotransferase subunit A
MLPRSGVLDDLDPAVAAAFDAALATLIDAGAVIVDTPMPVFDRQGEYFRAGGFAGAEAYSIHRRWLNRIGEYDPRVGQRILLGKDLSGADYVELTRLRAASTGEFESAAAPFDAVLMPTVPRVAPTIAEATASDEAYFRWNGRILRNVGLVNFLDGCAVTVPCQEIGTAPVGLSVCGVAMSDRHTLAVAAAVEAALGVAAE